MDKDHFHTPGRYTPSRGTILAYAKRSDCVILAADQLYSKGHGTASYSSGKNPKIIVSDRVPLAMASAGLRELRDELGPGWIETREILRNMLAYMYKEIHLYFPYIEKQMNQRLLPLVRTVRRQFRDD